MGVIDKFKKVEDDFIPAEDPVEKELKQKRNMKILIGVGIAAVLILIAILVKVLNTGKTDTTFYDVLSQITKEDLGEFSFKIDVNTSAKGSEPIAMEQEVTTEVATEISTVPEAESQNDSGSKHDLVDWNQSSDITTFNWDYPNYQISVDGWTASTEPLEMYFTVGLKTQYYSSEFTDVTVKDGKYYINVEAIRSWLINSRDSYLVGLGEQLPNGSKYLVIPESEFGIYSGFAESTEKDLSKRTLMQRYHDAVGLINIVASQIHSGIGSAGNVAKDNVVGLSLSGDDAKKALGVIESLVERRGAFYDSYLGTIEFLGDDNVVANAKAQAVREKDNILDAFNDVYNYFNTHNLADMNPRLVASGRSYTNSNGNGVVEITNLQFGLDGEKRNYMVTFSGKRTWLIKTVSVPEGSTFEKSSLREPDLVQQIIDGLISYLNVTPIKLYNRLDVTPSKIADNARDSFITLVNDLGCYNRVLTDSNLQTFLDKYVNYEEDDTTTDNDRICAQVASDFLNEMNGIAGGLVKEVEVVVNDPNEEEAERYPELVIQESGLLMKFKLDEHNSDSQCVVVKGRIENSTGSELLLNVDDFSVRTILNSIFPANNEVLIRNYDNNWDTSTLMHEVTLPDNGFIDFDMYFIIASDDTEASKHLDLYYNDERFGSIIEW